MTDRSSKPIRARITLRIHEDDIVGTVSDGEEVTLHRQEKPDAPEPEPSEVDEAGE